jgi:hypothetical protein
MEEKATDYVEVIAGTWEGDIAVEWVVDCCLYIFVCGWNTESARLRRIRALSRMSIRCSFWSGADIVIVG